VLHDGRLTNFGSVFHPGNEEGLPRNARPVPGVTPELVERVNFFLRDHHLVAGEVARVGQGVAHGDVAVQVFLGGQRLLIFAPNLDLRLPLASLTTLIFRLLELVHQLLLLSQVVSLRLGERDVVLGLIVPEAARGILAEAALGLQDCLDSPHVNFVFVDLLMVVLCRVILEVWDPALAHVG